MILTDKFYKRILLLCLSGLLTGITVAFPQFGILGWVSLIPFAIFLLSVASDEKTRLPALYGYGFAFFMSYYIVIFHWFVNLYPLEFIDGMTKGGALAVVLFASGGLAFFQAIHGGLLFVLAALLFRSHIVRKLHFLRPLILTALWTVLEWYHTVGWWGTPWGRISVGQTRTLFGIQTASLLGSYFVTFLVVLTNAYLAYGIIALITQKHKARRTALIISSVICLSALLIQYGGGLCLWLVNTPDGNEKKVTVAVIQGNIASGEKWEEDTAEKTLKIYAEYTKNAADEGAEIVVFPETALPWEVKEGNSRYQYLSNLAKGCSVTILAGVFTSEGENEYNSVVCFTPDGKMSDTVYNKRHLVPFGEFVPFKSLIETLVPPLAELVMSAGEVARGEGANIFELEQGRVGSLICFDSIFEELTLESVRANAELLCMSTNDSWFTDSAALYMHVAQAQLRAVESGRYIARAANTGISAIITNRGEVVEQLEPLVDGMIVKEVEIHTERTLYSYIGNLFVYLCMAFLTIILIMGLCRIPKRNEKI